MRIYIGVGGWGGWILSSCLNNWVVGVGGFVQGRLCPPLLNEGFCQQGIFLDTNNPVSTALKGHGYSCKGDKSVEFFPLLPSWLLRQKLLPSYYSSSLLLYKIKNPFPQGLKAEESKQKVKQAANYRWTYTPKPTLSYQRKLKLDCD